jgi:hypothetical protein
MPEFNIKGRMVGNDHAPLVIAEIGINHEGSLETAIAMADAAIDAGAEIVKHQTHVVEDEMSDEAKLVIPGNANVSIYEIMARCALDECSTSRRAAPSSSAPPSRAQQQIAWVEWAWPPTRSAQANATTIRWCATSRVRASRSS